MIPVTVDTSEENVPVVELQIPEGFHPQSPPRAKRQEWRRGDDPLSISTFVYVSFQNAWIGEPRPVDICSRDLVHGETADAAVRKIVHEVGEDFELALCEFEGLRPDGSRGSEAYLVRKWLQLGDLWLECKAVMRGRRAGPDGRWVDASFWTERQRADVLDICRSFRVARIEPLSPGPTPFDSPRP
jgi:hypothetical protein